MDRDAHSGHRGNLCRRWHLRGCARGYSRHTNVDADSRFLDDVAHGDACTDPHTHPDTYTVSHGYSHAVENTYEHLYCDCDVHRFQHGIASADRDANSDCHSNAVFHADNPAFRDAKPDKHSDKNVNGNTFADQDADERANRHHFPDFDARASNRDIHPLSNAYSYRIAHSACSPERDTRRPASGHGVRFKDNWRHSV